MGVELVVWFSWTKKVWVDFDNKIPEEGTLFSFHIKKNMFNRLDTIEN